MLDPPAATAPCAPGDEDDVVLGNPASEEEGLAAAGFEVRVGVPVFSDESYKLHGLEGHARLMSAAVTPARTGESGSMAASSMEAEALPAGNCRQFKRVGFRRRPLRHPMTCFGWGAENLIHATALRRDALRAVCVATIERVLCIVRV